LQVHAWSGGEPNAIRDGTDVAINDFEDYH
jgi:hypothetical protein